MEYTDELYEIYRIAGMQRDRLSESTMQDMDLAYGSLSALIGELDKLGIKSYLDLDKLTVKEDTEGTENNDN